MRCQPECVAPVVIPDHDNIISLGYCHVNSRHGILIPIPGTRIHLPPHPGASNVIYYDPDEKALYWQGRKFVEQDVETPEYLAPDPYQQFLRDVARENDTSIDKVENLLWDTMQAFLDMKKKLPQEGPHVQPYQCSCRAIPRSHPRPLRRRDRIRVGAVPGGRGPRTQAEGA